MVSIYDIKYDDIVHFLNSNNKSFKDKNNELYGYYKYFKAGLD